MRSGEPMPKECARVAVLTWLLASPLAAQVWTQLPGANAVLARRSQGGAYDVVRDRLVVFGGMIGGPLVTLAFGDTLEHDGTRWRSMSPPVAPSARWGHGIAFDVARARVVLFGGRPAGTLLNDRGEWDGRNWQQGLTVVAPEPRADMATTADPFRGGVLVHGGGDNVRVVLGDLWRWSGTQWLLQDSAGPLRAMHAMAIDPHDGTLVLFGGSALDIAVPGDTWLWNGSWRQLSRVGPPPRWGHRMASDFLRSRVVMSGGVVDTGPTAETWIFDGQQWIRLGDGPAQSDHVFDYDFLRGRCVAAGGYPVTLDVWSFGAAAAGTIQPFGVGCGSSVSSRPALTAATAPRLGTSLQLNTSSTPGTAVYLVGFSATRWNTLSLPLDLTPLGATGCVLYVEPAMMDVEVPVAGATTHSYAVPNDSALVGAEFFAQVLAADPTANTAGIAVSNALAGTIGP